jgi:Sulfotransferase domain
VQLLFITKVIHKLERAIRYFMRRHQQFKPVGHWALGKRHQAQLEVAEWRTKLGAKIAGRKSLEQGNTINPENLVWIFGMGRSGNTWLVGMMRDMPFQRAWDEPYVGQLFGNFYEEARVQALSRTHFIMGDPIRKGWVRSIRNFVLDGVGYVHTTLSPEEYVVIGEHNSSVGAPLLMEAFPDSRLILLIRDPRDIVASNLDAARKGGWLQQWRERGMGEELYHALAEEEPNLYVKELAERYVHDIGCAKRAYDSHKGRKVLVRYEDLRADTLGTMQRLYSTLEMPVNAEQLGRVVSAHSWENIPDKYKGPGKFTRKAAPGGWKEDLTLEQAQIVEEITAPLLKEFYSAR